MQVPRTYLHALVWLGFFSLLCYCAFTFADLDQLVSFADDSGSYLIMAKYFSPFSENTQLIEEAFLNERYPPLFPLLLALAGGAENFVVAHQLIVVMFIAACTLYAVWATRELDSNWLGLLVCLVFVLSPYVWPMLLRILSEWLYLALTLAVLIIAEPARKRGGFFLFMITLLLTFVILTRTIGVTLVVAWGVYLLMNRSRGRVHRLAEMLSITLPVATAFAWNLSRQSGKDDLYGSELTLLIDRFMLSSQPVQQFINYLVGQGHAIIDTWLGALMLAWEPGVNPRTFMALFLAAMVFAGWLMRLRKRQLDAWYSLFYVCVIFVWPFPGQFFRFILPLMPLFVVYAIQAAQTISGKYPSRLSPIVPGLTGSLFLALAAPAAYLVYQRFHYAPENGLDFSSNPEFYQEADIHRARDKAIQHFLLARDLKLMRAGTPSDAKIMWFTPGYISLLAERNGEAFPNVSGKDAMLSALADDPPDYIYISRLHPRRTTENGLAMLAWVEGAGDLEWSTFMPGSKDVFSVMFRLDDRPG